MPQQVCEGRFCHAMAFLFGMPQNRRTSSWSRIFIRNVQLSIHSKYSKCLIFRIRKEKWGISNISSILKMGVFESKSRDQVSMKMPSHDKILLHMFLRHFMLPLYVRWVYLDEAINLFLWIQYVLFQR